MQFFMAFLFLFLIVGMSTRSLGWFSYVAILGMSAAMAGTYAFSSAVW